MSRLGLFQFENSRFNQIVDGKHRLIHIIDKSLSLSLIEFLNEILSIPFKRNFQTAVFLQSLEVIGVDVNAFEKKNRLNKLLNAVKTVTSNLVDCIEEREDNLKRTEPSGIRRMEETLAAQPDYDQNRENYDALLAKLMARQKKTDTLVCAVLCIVAFILGVYTSTAGGIM